MATRKSYNVRLLLAGEEGVGLSSGVGRRPTILTIIITGPLGG